jgi:hypothetical protein
VPSAACDDTVESLQHHSLKITRTRAKCEVECTPSRTWTELRFTLEREKKFDVPKPWPKQRRRCVDGRAHSMRKTMPLPSWVLGSQLALGAIARSYRLFRR